MYYSPDHCNAEQHFKQQHSGILEIELKFTNVGNCAILDETELKGFDYLHICVYCLKSVLSWTELEANRSLSTRYSSCQKYNLSKGEHYCYFSVIGAWLENTDIDIFDILNIHNPSFNSALLYKAIFGTIGADMNLQKYKTFGIPMVVFLPRLVKQVHVMYPTDVVKVDNNRELKFTTRANYYIYIMLIN